MNPLEQVEALFVQAKELNEELRTSIEGITLMEAWAIIDRCREVEGWLQGVRKILMGNGNGAA